MDAPAEKTPSHLLRTAFHMNDSVTLLAGWMIDGTGAPARRRVLVRVDNGTVSSVEDAGTDGTGGSVGAAVHDFSTCTLVPGLVDAHVHLTLSGTVDPQVRREQLGYSFERNRPLMERRLAKYRSYGIVALRDGGDKAGHGLRFRTEWLPPDFRPQLRAAGTGWRAKDRYGNLIAKPVEGHFLADFVRDGNPSADHVKIVNSGLNSLTEFGRQTPPQFARADLAAAVAAALNRGMKTMVHANGCLPVAGAVDAGCASVEHGFFMGRENMEKMVERGIFWVPTAASMKAFLRHTPPGRIEAQTAAKNLEHQLEQISAARNTGVSIAVGSDSGGYGLFHAETFIEELKLLVEAGFGIEEAVRSASVEGARLLGLESEIGQIVPGSPATFVVVSGPPSQLPDSLRNVRSLYIRGKKAQ